MPRAADAASRDERRELRPRRRAPEPTPSPTRRTRALGTTTRADRRRLASAQHESGTASRRRPPRRLGPLPHRRARRPRLRRRASASTRRSRRARLGGRRPSACCSSRARSPRTSSRARSPSATGSTTSTSTSSRSTWRAANLIDSAAAKRYEAVPVAFARRAHAARRDGRPGERARGRRHRDADAARRARRPSPRREDIAALDRAPRPLRRRRRARRSTRTSDEDAGEVVDLRESADDAPVVKLVNSIIAQAAERGASDIHFEPDGARACACASASTACCRVSTTVPAADGRRRRLAHQDHGRPRHRRAAHAAGRARRPDASTAATSTCAS